MTSCSLICCYQCFWGICYFCFQCRIDILLLKMEAVGSSETLLCQTRSLLSPYLHLFFNQFSRGPCFPHAAWRALINLGYWTSPCNTGLCPWRNAVTSWGQAAVTSASFLKTIILRLVLFAGWRQPLCSCSDDSGPPLEFQTGWRRHQIRNMVSSSSVQLLLNCWWRHRKLKYLREAYVGTVRIFSVGRGAGS